MYNMGSAVEVLTGAAPLDAAPGLRAELEQATHALWLYLLLLFSVGPSHSSSTPRLSCALSWSRWVTGCITGCNPMYPGLQPHLSQAATPTHPGLQPYVAQAATLCIPGCNPMYPRWVTSSRRRVATLCSPGCNPMYPRWVISSRRRAATLCAAPST